MTLAEAGRATVDALIAKGRTDETVLLAEVSLHEAEAMRRCFQRIRDAARAGPRGPKGAIDPR